MNDLLLKQLALDYCCSSDELVSPGNLFTVYTPLEGRRRFTGEEHVVLRMAVFNGKLIFSGTEELVSLCREKYANTSSEWFIEPKNIRTLESMLRSRGCAVSFLHPFYTSDSPSAVEPGPFRFACYRGNEILSFRGDPRFDEAFAYRDIAPDMIGVAAFDGTRMLGMAGASADGSYLWQIGINVFTEARGRHLGTQLVSLLKNEILKEGRLPFYGTSFSHLASQRVALASGFKPAWVEMNVKQK